MTISYNAYNIESIEYNPFIKILYNENFTTKPITKSVTEFNTVQTIQSDLATFLLKTIIQEFNFKNNENHDYNNYGVLVMPNDQNARCSLLIFPLVTSEDLLIKVYIELGDMVSINFTNLGFIDSPNYSY